MNKMNNVSMNAHGIKEIRILRGQDESGLGHLLRVVIVDKDDILSDISLFGMMDRETHKDIKIPVKVTSDIQVTTHDISFIGDVIEEEE